MEVSPNSRFFIIHPAGAFPFSLKNPKMTMSLRVTFFCIKEKYTLGGQVKVNLICS